MMDLFPLFISQCNALNEGGVGHQRMRTADENGLVHVALPVHLLAREMPGKPTMTLIVSASPASIIGPKSN